MHVTAGAWLRGWAVTRASRRDAAPTGRGIRGYKPLLRFVETRGADRGGTPLLRGRGIRGYKPLLRFVETRGADRGGTPLLRR